MAGVRAPRRLEGLHDQEDCGEHHDYTVGREEDENSPPIDEAQELRADHRGEDGGEPTHQRKPGQHPHEGYSAEQIAHQGHRHDSPGSGTHALQHTEESEPDDVGREHGPEAGEHVHGACDDEGDAPAHPVAPRTDEQLANTEPEGRGGERELDDPRGHTEIFLQCRERGKVEIDREGAEGGERAEHDHVDEALAPGKGVSGMQGSRHL